MKIALESIKENLNYPNKKYDQKLLEIISLCEWISSSNKPFKNMHAFDVLIKENKKFKGKILVDHTKYAPLFLVFNSMNDLLFYCQDICEARGEKIPQNIETALDYFSNEEIYIHKINEWQLNQNEWNEIKKQIKKQK